MVPVAHSIRRNLLCLCLFVWGVLLVPVLPVHAERSPVFGHATLETLSTEASRDIMARGDWANYYGNYAVSFSYQAYIYSFYARYYAVSNSSTEQAWYAAASYYAYYAYIFASYAQSYSAAGM